MDKTALITGAAVRIGREIALTLARAGVNIIAHYLHSGNEASALKAEIEQVGCRCHLIQGDLKEQKELEKLIESAARVAGPFQILVNNASEFSKSTLQTLTLESLIEDLKIEFWAPFSLSRQFAHLESAEQIVNITDSRAIARGDANHLGYSLCKNLLDIQTRQMALEFAPFLRVNAVAPGSILPPRGKGTSYMQNLAPAIPLRKTGAPNSISEAVLFLIQNDFVTGQTISVDGGAGIC